jgi:hypothetical protein
MGADIVKLDAWARIVENGQLVRVNFAPHAVERFIQRVQPGLGEREAVLTLQGLCSAGSVTACRPDWLPTTSLAPLWLALGDVAFPLDAAKEDRGRLVATTCMCRG